jgi:hypothetical protein
MYMFTILYDTVWFVVIYLIVYNGIDLFFRDYSQALKVLFDVDPNHFSYNMEQSLDTKHQALFWVSSPISFMILTINPIVHSLMYTFVMLMINVTDLNRILYYILMFKLVRHLNVFERRVRYELMSWYVLTILTQLFFVVTDYSGAAIWSTVFQLIDESSGLVDHVLPNLISAHTVLFKHDTVVMEKLLNVKTSCMKIEREIKWVKLFIMAGVTVCNILYSVNPNSIHALTFCYYSGFRVIQIYLGDT